MANDDLDIFFKKYNLTKVSWYYYIEGLTQQEIADIMGLSRMKINKMLEEARQRQLIQFLIPMHTRERMELEKDIMERFSLEDVLIVPVSSPENINETLGKAAAIYLNSLIKDNTFINVGYGDTINYLISYLASISDQEISLVSLTGGVTPYLPTNGFGSSNVSLNLLPSPLFMNNKASADNMFKEKSVKEVFALADLASWTITGIGELSDDSTIIKQGIVSQHDITKIKLQGAKADILMHFIDGNGDLIDSEYEERVISTSLAQLKNRNNTIAVAGGNHKADAILAALKTNIFSRLVINENTAKKIMEGS